MPFNGAVRATIPNGTVRQAPPTKSSYRPIKHASAKLKKAAILKAADKKRSRFEEPIAKGDNTGFPVPKKDNLGQPVALTDRSNQPRKSTKIVAPVARVPEPNLQALSFNEKNQLTAAWLDEVHDLPAGVPDPQPIQSVVQDDASFFQGAYAPKNPDTNQIEDDYAALQQLGLKSSQMMRSEENPQRQAFQVNEYTNDMAPLHMMESHQIINFKEQPQYQTFQVNNYTNKLGRLQMMGSEEYPQRQSFQGFQGFQSFQGFQGFQSFQDPEYHHKSFQSYDDIDLDPDFEPDLSAFETNESQNTANNVFDPQYNMGDYIPGY
jgi:hypothetical protein